MNRESLLDLESTRSRRVWSDRPVELRRDAGGKTLTFDGYASITENAYTVYGGPPYGWNETIAEGAFKKTLSERADVSFLINHGGMSLARTKSGTLKLSEDGTGLRAIASLDPNNSAVRDLQSAIERRDVDEMSFGFRVVKDEWTDSRGEPASSMDGVNRRILEINLNKGDVSAVNYGANPATSGGFRDVDVALAELRAGRPLDEEQAKMIRTLVTTLDGSEDRATSVMTGDGMDQFDSFVAQLENLSAAMREHLNSLVASQDIEADGTFDGPTANQNLEPVEQRLVTLGPASETIAALIALHEQRR